MKIAVVGSRGYADLELVKAFVASLPPGITIISGGAVGVDRCAACAALKHGLRVIEYLPDYKAFGEKAPLIRNGAIVADADQLVAFWDGASRGTSDTISKARAKGIEVLVFGPDGKEVR